MPQLDRQLEMLIQHLPKVWDSPIEKIRGDVTTNHVEWLWIQSEWILNGTTRFYLVVTLPVWFGAFWPPDAAGSSWRFSGLAKAHSQKVARIARGVWKRVAASPNQVMVKKFALAWNVKLLTSAAYWCSSKKAKTKQKITRRCINVLSFSNTSRGFSSPGLMLTTLSARLIW